MAAPSVAPRNNTTRMEDFNVIKKLGQGSFGVVYSVIRKGRPGGETLVVKQINMGPHKSDQEEAINECRVLAKLDNKHVVKYHESFIDVGNKLCIVMEFAPKGTLHDLIQSRRGQPFSEDTVWKMLLQSTLGLHHIHGHKILHRDVKSENIFLDAGGNCKLGDLGVAKVLSTQVDFARTLVGTPYYLSPELCENKPYNHKSDVWSLGCVLYELLTQTHPFNAHSQGALFMKILKGKYPPVKGFSSKVTALLDRCLTTSTARRLDTRGILSSPASHEHASTLGLELPEDIPLPCASGSNLPPPASKPLPYPCVATRICHPADQGRVRAAAAGIPDTGAAEAGRRQKKPVLVKKVVKRSPAAAPTPAPAPVRAPVWAGPGAAPAAPRGVAGVGAGAGAGVGAGAGAGIGRKRAVVSRGTSAGAALVAVGGENVNGAVAGPMPGGRAAALVAAGRRPVVTAVPSSNEQVETSSDAAAARRRAVQVAAQAQPNAAIAARAGAYNPTSPPKITPFAPQGHPIAPPSFANLGGRDAGMGAVRRMAAAGERPHSASAKRRAREAKEAAARAERAARLRQKDIAAVADLPDFDDDEAPTPTEPQHQQQHPGALVMRPKLEDLSRAELAALTDEAYADRFEQCRAAEEIPAERSAAEGAEALALEGRIIQVSGSEIHGGTETAPPEELSAAIEEVTAVHIEATGGEDASAKDEIPATAGSPASCVSQTGKSAFHFGEFSGRNNTGSEEGNPSEQTLALAPAPLPASCNEPPQPGRVVAKGLLQFHFGGSVVGDEGSSTTINQLSNQLTEPQQHGSVVDSGSEKFVPSEEDREDDEEEEKDHLGPSTMRPDTPLHGADGDLVWRVVGKGEARPASAHRTSPICPDVCEKEDVADEVEGEDEEEEYYSDEWDSFEEDEKECISRLEEGEPGDEYEATVEVRRAELQHAMAVTEESAVQLIGSEAFACLHDFLKRRAEAIDEGRTEEVGAAGSIVDLSRLVFSIIPYEKAEAVTLVYRHMYLQGQLDEL